MRRVKSSHGDPMPHSYRHSNSHLRKNILKVKFYSQSLLEIVFDSFLALLVFDPIEIC